MENLKFDEFLRAGEPGAVSVANACAKLQTILTTELSTPLHLHSVDSRRKFFAFFPRFLDRVFGEDSEKQGTKNTAWIASQPPVSSTETSSSSQLQRSTSQQTNGPNAHLGEQGQALVELFQKSLFDFVFNISHAVRYRLDLTLLPLPAQVEIRNSGTVTPLYAKLFSTSSLSVNGKNQCFMVPIQSYLLFSLLRYPVSTSKLKRAAPTSSSTSGLTSSSGSTSSSAGNFWWRSTFPTDGMDSLTRRHPYNVLLLHYLQNFLPHGPEKLSFKSGRKQSMELFLNLLVELWFHQNQVSYGSDSNIHPLTLVKAVDQYTPPTDDLLCCLLLTLVHILADSHIPLLVHPSTQIVLKAIQKPLYDFFQIGFARSSPTTNPTSFCMLVEVFLAYLQPWQCVHWASSSSTVSKYSSDYSAYVLANYHFYTTLFGVFIVNARELEWDIQAVQMLERALNIYSDDLLALLHQAYCFLGQKPTATPLTSAESNVLTRHLTEFGLTSYAVSLSQDFRRNAEHVLDKLQYARDVNPKPSSAFLSVFSSSSGATSQANQESLESAIDKASARLRLVFEIPESYVPASSFQTPLARVFSLSSLDPSRDENNLLTAEGRAQIRKGLRLCSIDAVQYTGDPMLKPISSYEIPSLVRMWYKVSMLINTLLDLPQPDAPFRVNLRFLAAKSNVLWLSGFVLLTYLLLW
ncbi:unnamed protein product [Aphanomyces euteiches]|uniref:Sphingomyelin phosphodiesterase 4 n=1 Tax=Aphanomyces euteiches TaxID=100861 RepID=A0A6G0XJU3_9STRA|nr:hypothetical protein Ae201684_003983 [Aphanomyces euteiches]KAH9084576.1 hypothetical protein Ae201684P_001818 [Aphanomyces euteiches]